MRTIFVQIMTAGHTTWDDVPATRHEVEHVETTVQAIADATGCPVRFTYPLGDLGIESVGRLNGGYVRIIRTNKHNHFFLSTKAINVVSKIGRELPELDSDEPIKGTTAVDVLCSVWPEVKYIIDSIKPAEKKHSGHNAYDRENSTY